MQLSIPFLQRFKAAGDLISMQVALSRAAAVTALRRSVRGPRHEAWPWWLECVEEMMVTSTPCHDCITPDEVRRPLERVSKLPLPTSAHIEPASLQGVRGEWVSVDEPDCDGVVLYLHGGGYVSGSAQSHRAVVAQLARTTGMRVLSIDYRLAPEHPFPAALEDAWAAYWQLIEGYARPDRIAIAGDSAGGGLCVALLIALRDAGVPMPAAVACFSPWFDLANTGASIQANRETDYINEQILQACAKMYLNGQDACTPLASPLYADLRGLPPLLLQAGTAEVLADDTRRMAERAADQGVDVTLELYPQMIHVWHFLFPLLADARKAIESAGRFMRQHVPYRQCADGLNLPAPKQAHQ